MGFLIRMAFWFSLVLLALPLDPAGEGSPGVNPGQAFFAAREAVDDLSGICERKPEVCEVGKAAMQTIGVRAREGARIAFDMLEENEATGRATDEPGVPIAADPAVGQATGAARTEGVATSP